MWLLCSNFFAVLQNCFCSVKFLVVIFNSTKTLYLKQESWVYLSWFGFSFPFFTIFAKTPHERRTRKITNVMLMKVSISNNQNKMSFGVALTICHFALAFSFKSDSENIDLFKFDNIIIRKRHKICLKYAIEFFLSLLLILNIFHIFF